MSTRKFKKELLTDRNICVNCKTEEQLEELKNEL